MKWNWRLWLHQKTHHIIDRGRWMLIVGRDFHNTDYGFTFFHGPLPPNFEWRTWSREMRVNVRWPIEVKYRRRKSPAVTE